MLLNEKCVLLKCGTRDFYEAPTENGSVPVYLPLKPDMKPDIYLRPLRTRAENYPRGELAHTYMEILDQLWQLQEVRFINSPQTLRGSEFKNVAMIYAKAPNAPILFTTAQAAWAALEVLDHAIKHSDPANPNWSPLDWSISNAQGQYGTIESTLVSASSQAQTFETAKRQRRRAAARSTDENSFLQDLATPPLPQPELPPGYLSLNAFDNNTALAVNDASSTNTSITNEDVTVDVTFKEGTIPFTGTIYHFRTFALTAMRSNSAEDVSTRWERGRTIVPDTRVTRVEAVMTMIGPRGLFPPRFTFADLTNGLRQILAKCLRRGAFVPFEAAIRKEGIVVAELVMAQKTGEEEVASA